jgi:uncharacterized membrane protein (UPF0136 family)
VRVVLALVPHDLTHLPDVLSVGIGLGLVAGGLIGFFWGASTDADLVNNVAAGSTLGSFAGALLSTVVWLVATGAGA